MPPADVPRLTKAVAKKHGGFAEVGRRVGVSGRAVKNYADGIRAPRPAVLAKLEALASGSEADATPTPRAASTTASSLDTAPGRIKGPASGSATGPRADASPGIRARVAARVAATAPTREQTEGLVNDLDELLTAALADDSASYRDRAAVAAAKNAALRTLATMRGEGHLTAAMIVRSPVFREALETIERALTPHPQAARAVAEEVARLFGEGH